MFQDLAANHSVLQNSFKQITAQQKHNEANLRELTLNYTSLQTLCSDPDRELQLMNSSVENINRGVSFLHASQDENNTTFDGELSFLKKDILVKISRLQTEVVRNTKSGKGVLILERYI